MIECPLCDGELITVWDEDVSGEVFYLLKCNKCDYTEVE